MDYIKSCTITISKAEQEAIHDIMSILLDYEKTGIDLDDSDIVCILMAIQDGEKTGDDDSIIEGIKIEYCEE